METDIDKIVYIAGSAQKAFRNGGLCAAIDKLKGIQSLVAGGSLSEIYGDIDLLIEDLERYKGHNTVEQIETFIEIICSRYKHEERMT